MELQITDTELLEKSYQWLRKLSLTGGRDWSLSIPVNPDDPDIVLGNLLRRFKKYSEALENIDTLLAHLEDYTHGEDGKRITEARGIIQQINQ